MREIKQENLGVGYKVFDENWKCRDFQFEVGKQYTIDGPIKICERGFHFCNNLIDCFIYKEWNPKNKVAIIHYDKSLAIESESDKSCVEFIHIVKELDWNEIYKICNTGLNNTGNGNSGNWNSGNGNSGNGNSGDSNSGNWNSGVRNSGNWNSGNWNSGVRNSGNWNSGVRNSGNGNSGDSNSGDSNSGNWNSGNWNSGNGNSGDSNSGNGNSGDSNSGDWNSGDWNSGVLNTVTPNVRIFNKDSLLTFEEMNNSEWYLYLARLELPINEFIFSQDMSDEEKEKFPHHETLGGYLKKLSYKESWAKAIPGITNDIRKILESIPNWNPILFEEITGIKV